MLLEKDRILAEPVPRLLPQGYDMDQLLNQITTIKNALISWVIV